MEKNSIRWEILLKGARGTLSPEEEIIFQKWLAGIYDIKPITRKCAGFGRRTIQLTICIPMCLK